MVTYQAVQLVRHSRRRDVLVLRVVVELVRQVVIHARVNNVDISKSG